MSANLVPARIILAVYVLSVLLLTATACDWVGTTSDDKGSTTKSVSPALDEIPLQLVTDTNLSDLVLGRKDIVDGFPDLSTPKKTGLFIDDDAATYTVNPTDRGSTLRETGFLAGFERSFSDSEVSIGQTIVSRVFLWDGDVASSDFMRGYAPDINGLTGTEDHAGLVVRDFRELNDPGIGDMSSAALIVGGLDSLRDTQVFATAVSFQRDNFVGTASLMTQDNEDHLNTVTNLAKLMIGRIDAILGATSLTESVASAAQNTLEPEPQPEPADTQTSGQGNQPPPITSSATPNEIQPSSPAPQSQSNVPAAAVAALGRELSGFLLALEDLPPGTVIEHEGLDSRPGPPEGYQRRFRSTGGEIPYRNSRLAEIRSTVWKYASPEDARASVEVLASPGGSSAQALGGSSGPGSAQSFEFIVSPQIGDPGRTIMLRANSTRGQSVTIHFSRGQLRMEIVAVGRIGGVTTRDVVRLATIADKRIVATLP